MEADSRKLLSIDSVVVDIDYVDRGAQLWITTAVNNMTDKAQKAQLALVLQKQEARETIEIVEVIEPGINQIDSMIRIVDLNEWESDDKCVLMLGLRCEDKVQDVKEQEVILN